MDTLADTTMVVLVFATLAAAWSWLGSYAGVVSFGHAVFFGIGAFGVAVSNLRGGSPWYGALGGALFALVIAAACGSITLRGRGYSFTAITLAIGIFAEPLVASRSWLGAGNVYAFPVHPSFFNLQFSARWPYVLLALAVLAVTQALTFGLRALPLGYQLRALRTDPAGARSVGVAALPPRLTVLAASAFVTSVAGSLSAEYAMGVTPHAFALTLSFDIALAGIVAGPLSPWAAPIAGALFALVARYVPLHPGGIAGVAVLAVEGAIVLAVAWRQMHGWPAGIVRRPAAAVRGA